MSESPFSGLPSLSELLNHPTVQRVVERVNQTTVAQRATGYLEELKANLKHRVEHVRVPSLGELAERLAARLLGAPQALQSAVNATGTVLGTDWPTLPLAQPAVDELVRLASEYQVQPSLLVERTAKALEEASGAEAAWVTERFSVAAQMVQSAGGTVDVARYAGLLNPAEFNLSPLPTVAERLQGGAELVVIDGAGLLGGPSCGIVLGRRGKIDELVQQAPADLSASHFTLSALAGTLAVYQSAERVIHQIPVWQLLTAPLENLEQRSHRLATLLAACDKVADAKPTRCESVWCEADSLRLTGLSWAVALRSPTGDLQPLASALEAAEPHILGRISHGELWLDLRSVFPRWDQHLVSAIA